MSNNLICKNGHDTSITGRYANGRCAACNVYQTKKWRDIPDNRKRLRILSKVWQWKKWGIINKDGSPFTIIDFDREFQIQNGCCKGCKKNSTELTKPLMPDHDHETHVFRMLLCNNCNFILGLANSNVDVLQNLMNCLKEGK